MSLIVEYIWTDTDGITFRSKTRMFYGENINKMNTNPKDYPEWSYDGSSTGDVNINVFGTEGAQTECRLIPYFVYMAPESHIADRYVLCMSKEIRDTAFCDMCNTSDNCVCFNAPDNQPGFPKSTESIDTGIEYQTSANINQGGQDGQPENNAETSNTPEEMDDETIEYYLNAEDDDINGLYGDDFRPNWPDKDYENYTSDTRYDNDNAIDFWMTNPKIWKHRPQIGFEQEFFVIHPDTGYPVGFVQSACPFNRFLSHLGLQPRYTPVSGKQGPYYCSNGFPLAQLREMMDEVLLIANEMEIGVSGFNYEVAPGQAEFQVFGDAWEACNNLVMLRFLLVRTAEKYGFKIDFRPVVVPGQKINNSGCHVNFSTAKMRAKGGLDYIFAFLEYLSDNSEAFPNKYLFESIYGKGVCERLTGKLETSNWLDFTWGIGTRDTSVRIPIGVNDAKCGYFEDRRPGSNVNPYIIAQHIFNNILEFEDIIYSVNFDNRTRAQAAKDAKKNIGVKHNPQLSSDINAQEETQNTVCEELNSPSTMDFTPEEPSESDEDEEPKTIASKVLAALGF